MVRSNILQHLKINITYIPLDPPQLSLMRILNNKYTVCALRYYLSTRERKDSLFVCNDVNAGVVKGGGLGKEWSDDGHGSRDSLGVTK